MKVNDADGHVMERVEELIQFMPPDMRADEPQRWRIRCGSITRPNDPVGN